MPSKTEKIRDTMFSHANPVIFRSAAYLAAIGVVGTDNLLGGGRWAILVAISLVAATNFILPVAPPEDNLRNGILTALHMIRCRPWRTRLACAILMVVGVSALDYYVGGSILGREFNLYLIPIFLTSLLFGFPLAILTWLFSFLTVCYLAILSRISFFSLEDFADLVGFFYLGLIALAIPVLIRSSSVADEGVSSPAIQDSLPSFWMHHSRESYRQRVSQALSNFVSRCPTDG
jgi:hypothetical protein